MFTKINLNDESRVRINLYKYSENHHLFFHHDGGQYQRTHVVYKNKHHIFIKINIWCDILYHAK